MYAQDDKDNVVLTITKEEFAELLMQLGYALGALQGAKEQRDFLVRPEKKREEERIRVRAFNRALKLANSINDGNPNWKPYELLDEPK